jgi:hypothetical protein
MNFRMPAVLIFFLLICLPIRSEHIFLKDGSIISGQVIRDGADSVTVRDSDKKTRDVKRSDIMRILYTELKMGRIYIQKRDGKVIVAHMVDEDRDSYTFRYDLYKPEEFTLKRSAVLFIAEKNPSGLQVVGDIGTDRVSLTWEPPYDKVKIYNVYIKKNEKDKYELADSTGGRSVTLKKLSSNTTYFLIVTSVDTTNYESSPSNELQVRTKNIPPDEPARVIYTPDPSGARKITWKPARDPDGTVVKYRIFTRHGGEKKLLQETKTKPIAGRE